MPQVSRLAASLLALALVTMVGASEARAQCSTTHTVTNTNDAGAGSLRAAITAANACPNSTINFNIPGSGTHVIQLASALPPVTSPTTINGYSQPGSQTNTAGLMQPFNGQIRIELRGAAGINYGIACASVERASLPLVVRGLAFNNFPNTAIYIFGCDDSRIFGNFIGTNAAGTAPGTTAGTYGVLIADADDVWVGTSASANRNVISGSQFNIAVLSPGGSVANTLILNNFIGTDSTGNAGIGGTGHVSGTGVALSGDQVTNANVSLNIISGHADYGIWISGDSNGHTISGNAIGAGNDAIGEVTSLANGLPPAPVTFVPGLENLRDGIRIGDAANMYSSDNNSINANVIHFNQEQGINLESGLNQSVSTNSIFSNGQNGVLQATGRTVLSSNRISDNGLLGIDVLGDGVTETQLPVLNPIVGNTSVSGTTSGITGTVSSIEFFASPTCDPSGNGEGQVFLGALSQPPANFTYTHPQAVPYPYVTAVATVDVGTIALIRNSYEFSDCVRNPPPVVANPLPDQNATEDVAFSYVVAGTSFSDPGDVLTYAATLSSGNPLPGWLSFTPQTRTFAGTPSNADVGSVDIQVTATDTWPSSTSDVFRLTVINANDPPTVANPIPNQTTAEDAAFDFQFAANTFTDPDAGDTLTYAASLSGGGALPGWLSFSAGARRFTGTPANADVGTISVRVTASDTAGAQVSDVFDITVTNTNDPPIVANPIPNQTTAEDTGFSFQFAGNTFTDPDAGDTLTYTAALPGGGALPAWLTFNAGTRTFSGTPSNADVGTITVRVTARDIANASAFDDFDVTVTNVNDPPVVQNPIPDQTATEDVAYSFSFSANVFSDPDAGDALTYGATLVGGGALPGWLTFTPASRRFAGTPANANVGTINIRVSATDNSGATITDDFTLTVNNTNDPPVVQNAIPDQTATEDAAFSFQFAANTFSDPDAGDTLTYGAALAAGGALPAWLSFNSGSRTFSGTPANADVGTIRIRVTATDAAAASVGAEFDLTVVNTNDPPVLANPIPDRNATEDALFNFTFAANTFADPDIGDTLSYAATLVGGGALPAWLSLAGRTFSGTPTNADLGTISVMVTATDSAGASAVDQFDITVGNTNDPPTLDNPVPDQTATEGVLFSFTFAANTFSDPDVGDTLTYSAVLSSGPDLPTWLAFDSATRTFSGTPDDMDVGTISIRLTATDTGGGSAQDDFDLTVTGVNDGPTIDAIADVTTDEDTTTTTIAVTVFDPDNDLDTLVVTASVADPTLVDNTTGVLLGGTNGNRTLRLVPNADAFGSTLVTVTVSDGAEVTSTQFTLDVLPINDAPIAVDDLYAGEGSGTLVVDAVDGVLANDTDIEADPLSAFLVTDVAEGTLALNEDGSFSYEPPVGFVGEVTFAYLASDGALDSPTATVTLIIGAMDTDNDGVLDPLDNCVMTPNPNQEDLDGDGDGDVCDDDADGDGFLGSVDDCADLDAAINPDAEEICDNDVDENCDGKADPCDSPPDCDLDADGFEAPTCGGNDCNDNAADVNPDRAEICTNQIDDDCNGLTDADDPACTTSEPPEEESGCQCNASSTSRGAPPFGLAFLLVGLMLRRRRR